MGYNWYVPIFYEEVGGMEVLLEGEEPRVELEEDSDGLSQAEKQKPPDFYVVQSDGAG